MSDKGNLIICGISFLMGFFLFIAGITIGVLGMTKAGSAICVAGLGCLLIAWASWKEVIS